MTGEDRPKTIGDIVQGWARQTSDAPALLELGRIPLTYRGLADVCTSFRASLNRNGIGRNDRVAVVHPGGPDMAASIVAIWGSAATVPFNPDYTAGEFAIYFKDLKVDCLAIAAGMDNPARGVAARLDIPILEIAHTDDAVAGAVELTGTREADARQPGGTQPEDLGLVVFTSGTTSRSKIVPRLQRHLWWNAFDFARAADLAHSDRLLSLMPLFHSGGLSHGFAAVLFSGGSIAHMPRFSADTFFDGLSSLAPTWYYASPTFHQKILSLAPDHGEAIAASNLRFVRSGAAHLPSETSEALEMLFDAPIAVGYGSSETGQVGTNGTTFATRKTGSVGKIWTNEVSVMGRDGTIVPTGEPGEVVVRGPLVFDGYEDDDAANAAAFRDGWFHTGDEGRFDEDGFLFLTGRIKELINRGGEKISPPEVDEVLLRHHDVAEAVTFPIPHPTLGEEVAAAVVLKQWAGLDAPALTRFAHQHLTGFKVPRRILIVDEIPKLGTAGKVQRGQLAKAFGLDKATDARRSGAPATDRAPTPLEARLADMWARALRINEVGLDDDFFLLGGDSLQAVDLFLEIETELGRRLPRAVLFEASTVAEMARRIEDESPVACAVPIQPKGDLPPFFCVHGATGEVLNFGELAVHLGMRQPFYGLQSPGLEDAALPFSRTEDMASYYIVEMRKVQGSGPYYLGGYSSGGRVAVEMARQLRESGEEIAFVGLLDAYCFIGRRKLALDQRIAINLARLGAMTPRQRLSFALSKAGSRGAVLAAALRRRFYRAGVARADAGTRSPSRLLPDIEQINMAMNARFQPLPYDGAAVLFKATRFGWANPHMYGGWRDIVTGGIDVRPTPGGHYDIVKEPHVRTLAAQLGECLDAARRARTGDKKEKTSVGSLAAAE